MSIKESHLRVDFDLMQHCSMNILYMNNMKTHSSSSNNILDSYIINIYSERQKSVTLGCYPDKDNFAQ